MSDQSSNYKLGKWIGSAWNSWGKDMKFLVDTGAAISIMSTGMFQSLSDPTLMLLNNPYDICAANGRCLEV